MGVVPELAMLARAVLAEMHVIDPRGLTGIRPGAGRICRAEHRELLAATLAAMGAGNAHRHASVLVCLGASALLVDYCPAGETIEPKACVQRMRRACGDGVGEAPA
jgi:hypothetical protein